MLIAHFLGDFILQSDWMALNKSKDNGALSLHCVVYSMCFIPWGLKFYVVTYLFHFMTDFVTSRITSRLWFIQLLPRPEENIYPEGRGAFQLGKGNSYFGAYPSFAYVDHGKRHWFFVAIGADQLIHFATLALTYHLLIGG